MLQLWILLGFVVAGICLGTTRRVRVWRKGKGPTERLSPALILSIPKRYFVDLHHIVMRDKRMAFTHILVAGGTVALVILMPWVLAGLGITQWLAIALLACVGIGSISLMIRRIGRQRKLSYGAFMVMPLSLAAFALGSSGLLWYAQDMVSDTLSWASLALAVVGASDLFWSGRLERPFKHMIAGSAHLAFHPRQSRFAGTLSTALKPMRAAEQGKHHGVRSASDFTWQQVLGFDACIECGKCQEACPAFAAGQPLNPKQLMQDLLLSAQGGNTSRYSGAGYPAANGDNTNQRSIDGADVAIAPNLVSHATLYACTTCRACVEVCPMLIEQVDAIVDLRRHLTLDRGELPGKGHELLANLRHTDTQSGNRVSNRSNWAVDLKLPFAGPDVSCELLLLSGEGAFDLRHQQVLRKLVGLVKESGLSIALLADEPDCGDSARRLGDEVSFVRLAQKLAARLKQAEFSRIVTCDPHLYNVIRNELPEVGFTFPIVHHSQLLLELIDEHQLGVSPLGVDLTYHDPCYLGRYNGVYDAPRQLLQKVGVAIKEMHRSAHNSRCCGWGGGAAFTDVPGARRIPDMRMEDVYATGVSSVAVACPNCMTMLEGVVPQKAEVLDIVDLTHRSHHHYLEHQAKL